jgi:DNA invertase Pin-like site-specific DNA recombinase
LPSYGTYVRTRNLEASPLILNVIGSFAEFERALIKERLREGVALAKKAGVYSGLAGSFIHDYLPHEQP